MDCQEVDDWIQSALDGALTAPERTRLDTHLADCPSCRAAWDEYRSLSRAASAWAHHSAVSADPGESFTDRVMARIAAAPVPARSPHRQYLTALCLAGAILGLAYFCQPALSSGMALLAVLFPHPQEAFAFPAWLAANLHTVPDAASGALSRLWSGVTVPSWTLPALGAALLVNALLALSVRQSTRRQRA